LIAFNSLVEIIPILVYYSQIIACLSTARIEVQSKFIKYNSLHETQKYIMSAKSECKIVEPN
jgi:hypothetical protein